jgi:anhydro-N-acetylmuramic acid kinase
MDSKDNYKVIGLMSGTSLDGVDLASCVIRRMGGVWAFAIEHAQTVQYSSSWKKKLQAATEMRADELLTLHQAYGNYLGVLVRAFQTKRRIRNVDFIASHGHTIFHQTSRGLTFQLGSGMALHAATDLPVVYDFRSLDVALGGQGAPLVPAGDRFLFSEYNICLNIGGIANLSTDVRGRRIAFDICFANMGLNYLAATKGASYDKNGAIAASGTINESLLKQLSAAYERWKKKRPSLSYEMFVATIKPILNKSKLSPEDKLATFTESIALEIASAIPPSKKKQSMLCTGGGAFNSYLIYRIMEHCGDQITVIVPEDDVVKYKEALVFAFLGVLRVRNEVNCLRSVTGARRDTSSGLMVGF